MPIIKNGDLINQNGTNNGVDKTSNNSTPNQIPQAKQSETEKKNEEDSAEFG